jgi:diguanylate cyclase (GGDEF)-like protein
MLLLDETPYESQKEIGQVAPTGIIKASAMAAAKLPVDFAAGAVLIAGGVESLVTGGESEELFKGYDEVYKPIQDALTPEPGSVSAAGRFISGIAGFAPALALGPAGVPLLAGINAIDTGVGLVEQGVEAKVATGGAILAGATATAMAGLPNAAPTWGKTLALAALNPVIGAASTQAEKSLLEAGGYAEIAKQYDPFDPVARSIDSVMGLAFGTMGKYSLARAEMLTKTKDSIDTMANWQRMFKDTPFDTADPKSADLGYKAMQKALADISQGKPVDLSGVLPDVVPVKTEKALVRAETAEAKQAIVDSIKKEVEITNERRGRGRVPDLDWNQMTDAQKEYAAHHDYLTGLQNRRQYVREHADSPVLGVVDLDGFGNINKQFGQLAGDQFLKKVAEAINRKGAHKFIFRPNEGGDELFIPGKTEAEVRQNADLLDKALLSVTMKVRNKDGETVILEKPDFSIGIAQGDTYDQRYEAASQALNEHKSARQLAEGRGPKTYPARMVIEPESVRLAKTRSNDIVREQRAGEQEPVTPASRPVINAEGRAELSGDQKTWLQGLSDTLNTAEAKKYITQKAGQDEATGWTGSGFQFIRDLPQFQHINLESFDKAKDMNLIAKAIAGEPLGVEQQSRLKNMVAGWDRLQEIEAAAKQSPEMHRDMILDDPAARRMESRFAAEGDFPLQIGTDAVGSPISMSAVEFIRKAKEDYRALEANKDIISRISDCV